MLNTGDRAPEFYLPDQDMRPVSLSSLLNGGPLLLHFYPSNAGLLGILEAQRIAAMHTDLRRSGLSVACVSPNSVASNRRFQERFDLPFPVLSDHNRTVIRMYDVRGPWGLSVRRTTYLISPARLIRGAVLASVRLRSHNAFMLDAAEDLDTAEDLL